MCIESCNEVCVSLHGSLSSWLPTIQCPSDIILLLFLSILSTLSKHIKIVTPCQPEELFPVEQKCALAAQSPMQTYCSLLPCIWVECTMLVTVSYQHLLCWLRPLTGKIQTSLCRAFCHHCHWHHGTRPTKTQASN